jgi:hypothetical protein
MDLIFIDANIYLNFYSNSIEFNKLLSCLTEIKSKILVPKQIVYEVERNKMGVFRAYYDGLNQSKINNISLLTHIESDKSGKISEWNKKSKKIKTEFEQLNRELEEIKDLKFKEIHNSSDEVSKILKEIFKKAKEATEKEFENARLRKERGNPPGKKGDTLGDQISWEQILTISPEVKRLWIVSNDGDYIESGIKEDFLNPLLLNDLKKINPKIEVYCFKTITDALPSFSKISKTKIETLPSDKELKELREVENVMSIAELVKNIHDAQNDLNFANGLTNYSNIANLQSNLQSYRGFVKAANVAKLFHTSSDICSFCNSTDGFQMEKNGNIPTKTCLACGRISLY